MFSINDILCSEVSEHVPKPTHEPDEFPRLFKPGVVVIQTTPFASSELIESNNYCYSFSRYSYWHYLPCEAFKSKISLPIKTGKPCSVKDSAFGWVIAQQRQSGLAAGLSLRNAGDALFNAPQPQA